MVTVGSSWPTGTWHVRTLAVSRSLPQLCFFRGFKVTDNVCSLGVVLDIQYLHLDEYRVHLANASGTYSDALSAEKEALGLNVPTASHLIHLCPLSRTDSSDSSRTSNAYTSSGKHRDTTAAVHCEPINIGYAQSSPKTRETTSPSSAIYTKGNSIRHDARGIIQGRAKKSVATTVCIRPCQSLYIFSVQPSLCFKCLKSSCIDKHENEDIGYHEEA